MIHALSTMLRSPSPGLLLSILLGLAALGPSGVREVGQLLEAWSCCCEHDSTQAEVSAPESCCTNAEDLPTEEPAVRDCADTDAGCCCSSPLELPLRREMPATPTAGDGSRELDAQLRAAWTTPSALAAPPQRKDTLGPRDREREDGSPGDALLKTRERLALLCTSRT